MNPNHIANGNYQSPQKDIDLGEKTKLLLENEEIKRLPEAEQGEYIVEQLLGRIIAAGPIESGVGEKSPLDVIKDIESYAADSNKLGHNQALSYLTRKNGIRSMVHHLAQDVRIGPFWNDLSNRVVSRYGSDEITMSSMPMMNGYLDAINETSVEVVGSGWKEHLLQEVEDYSKGKSRGRWTTRELASSDVSSVGDKQRQWERALSDARQVGVDPNLIVRSAERFRLLDQAGKDIGRRALDMTNYDHLFEA